MKSNKTEKVKRIFDSWALSGRADKIETGHTYSVNGMLPLFKADINFSFLDIGCGNGWTVRRVAESAYCKRAMGIDVSPEMIRLANKRKVSDKEQYICIDICKWDTHEKFDVIFLMETLYYITPLPEMLEIIYRILSNDGILIVGMDFYKENKVSVSWPKMVGLDMQLKSISEWEVLIKGVGFTDIEFKQIKDSNSEDEWKRIFGTLVFKAIK